MSPTCAGDPLPFPAHLAHRVIGEVGGTENGGIFRETQDCVRAKGEGAGEIVTGGNQNLSAAQNRAAVDCLLQAVCVFGGSVAFGAEVAGVQRQHSFRRDRFCMSGCLGRSSHPRRRERGRLEETTPGKFHHQKLSLLLVARWTPRKRVLFDLRWVRL